MHLFDDGLCSISCPAPMALIDSSMVSFGAGQKMGAQAMSFLIAQTLTAVALRGCDCWGESLPWLCTIWKKYSRLVENASPTRNSGYHCSSAHFESWPVTRKQCIFLLPLGYLNAWLAGFLSGFWSEPIHLEFPSLPISTMSRTRSSSSPGPTTLLRRWLSQHFCYFALL